MRPSAFVLFGASHLLALLLPFVLAALAVLLVKPAKRPGLDHAIRLTLAALMTLNWFGWMFMLRQKGWLGVDNAYPMNLCDWATVATIITLVRPNQRSYELAYFWALAGTLQGMLTPDVKLDFPDIQFLLFFVFHGGIIAGVLYLTWGLRLRPYPQSIPRVIGLSLLYGACAGLVDWMTGANYGMLARKPPFATVLDFLPRWPYYVAVLVAMALVSIAFYYAPFWIMDRLKIHNRGTCDDRHRQHSTQPF